MIVREAVLGQAATGKTEDEIIELLGLSATAIQTMRRLPEFRQRHDEAIASAVAAARGQLVGTLPKAVEVIDDTIAGRNKSPLKLRAAESKVKGLGVYSDTERVEHSGVIGLNRSELHVILADPALRELALQLQRAMETRASLGSGETKPGGVEPSKAP